MRALKRKEVLEFLPFAQTLRETENASVMYNACGVYSGKVGAGV
jgi:hypothetical protein